MKKITDTFNFIENIKDDSFDLIIADPPYDLDQERKMFLHNHFLRICGSWIIVFSPPENQWILPAYQYLFWIKPISTKNTSKKYSRFVEMIFLYNGGHWNTNYHWSQYTNVFTDLVDRKNLHPHRKPPSLIERLILNHTQKGDRVFDPFAGSGVVEDICIKLEREYVGVDLYHRGHWMSK